MIFYRITLQYSDHIVLFLKFFFKASGLVQNQTSGCATPLEAGLSPPVYCHIMCDINLLISHYCASYHVKSYHIALNTRLHTGRIALIFHTRHKWLPLHAGPSCYAINDTNYFICLFSASLSPTV